MKVVSPALEAKYALGTVTFATALRITREDGEVFAFHTHDSPVEVDGVTYSSDPGLTISEIAIEANCNVGNLELRTLHDGTVFNTLDVLGGVWRNAAFALFRYDWSAPEDGVEALLSGTVGEVQILQNEIVAELRDLRQYLQQEVGDVTSKTCRYRLFDERCMLDQSDHIVSGTITHIAAAKRVFRDSARTEAEDWFGWGIITFTSGNNAGLSSKMEYYESNGTFTLSIPLFANVQVGDTYSAIPGCRGRRDEDCDIKYSNALNFGGEPDRQGMDAITGAPTADV